MKNITLYILFITIAAAGCAVTELIKNDLTESCLNGKVKRMKSTNYSKAISTAAGYIPDTASWRIGDRIVIFNEDGNIVSISSASKYRDYKTIRDLRVIEYNGKEKTGSSSLDSAGNVIGHGTVQWISDLSYVENGFDFQNKHIVISDTTLLDRQFRLKTLTSKFFIAPDSVGLYTKSVYEYDGNNNLKTIIDQDLLNHTTDTIFFKVLKKDEHNNYIEMLNIRNHRKDTGIFVRSYLYY